MTKFAQYDSLLYDLSPSISLVDEVPLLNKGRKEDQLVVEEALVRLSEIGQDRECDAEIQWFHVET